MHRTFIRAGIFSLFLAAATATRAQTYHLWDGGGADNNWGTAANWNPDGAVPNPTTNYINLAGTNRLTPNVNTNWTIFGLFVSNNAGAFTVSGSNVTITAATPDANAPHAFETRSASNFVMQNSIILQSSTNRRHQFLISGAGSANFNGIITNVGVEAADLWIRGSGTGTGTITNRIMLGTNTLAKADIVTWVLGNTNNSWGNTEIYQTGVLRIAASDVLPTNTLVSFPAASTGGRLDLNNFNQTVAGLSAPAAAVVAAVRTGTNAGGRLTIASDNSTNTFYGSITENGSLQKLGSSVQILMTNNAFTGNVVVAGGSLQFGAVRTNQIFGALGPNNAGRTVIITNGAKVDLRGRDLPAGTNQVWFIYSQLTNEGFSTIGPIFLNGGRIEQGNGYSNGNYQGLALRNSVTVTGSVASVINGLPSTGNGIHLEQPAVVFDVHNVTANASPDLTVSAILVNASPNVGGAGGFVKRGSGTMLLDGVNQFTGTMSIVQGTVALSATGSVNSATVQIGSGTIFDVAAYGTNYVIPASQVIQGSGMMTGSITAASGVQIFPGSNGLPGTLTFAGDALNLSASFTNQFDLTNNTAIGGGNDLLVVNSTNFNPNNSVVKINPLAPLTSGTYRLVSYTGAKTGSFAAGVLGNTTRDSWSLDQTSSTQVTLVVTSGTNQLLTWSGSFSSNWDLGTTSNWINQGTAQPDAFYDLDNVVFDDSGATVSVVNLTGVLKPGSITVISSSNYTFSGPGGFGNLGTAATLTKDGAGTLVLAMTTTNNYLGATVLSNGTVQVGAGGAVGSLGPAPALIGATATLRYFRSDGAYTIPNTLSGAGTQVYQGPGATGQGAYVISGINTGFVGSVIVTNARYQADAVTDLGGATQVTVQARGQLYVSTTVSQPVSIAGTGWAETAGTLGAIRLQGGTLAGTVTLAGDARIGAFAGNGALAGQVTGPYELEYWCAESTPRTISVGAPVPNDVAATRITSNAIVIATNVNAFNGGTLIMNGGTFRQNGMNFAYSNLSATTGGGAIQNGSTTGAVTAIVGATGLDQTFLGSFQNGSTQALNLLKTGAGTFTLFNNAATGTATLAQGTLVISNGSWSGPLTLSTGTTAVAIGGAGLLGQYYNVTSTVVNATNVNIANLTNFVTYLADKNPNILYHSAATGPNFDFGQTGALFPPVIGGFNNMQVKWSGKFFCTNAGVWTFYTASDDGSTLFIDGALVVNNNTNQGIFERSGTVTLTTGPHDISVAYFQGGGGLGLTNNVQSPGGAKQPLSNLLLGSGPGIGALSGPEGSALIVSNGLLTIAQSVDGTFAGTISGNGGLQKIGTGTLVLQGAATYTDATVVAGGALYQYGGIASPAPVSVQAYGTLGGTGAIGGVVTMDDGALLHVATAGGLGTLPVPGLTQAPGATNVFDFGATTNDLLAVSGALVPNGSRVLVNLAAPIANGSYPIVSYGSLTGTYNASVFNLNGAASGPKRVSLDYATTGLIQLVVGDGKTLAWRSTTSVVWDVATTANWRDGLALTNETFQQGDAVLFDDAAGVTQVVSIVTNTVVWPAGITVDTTTNAFTLQIGGSLNGGFTLTKNGTNTLTVTDSSGGLGSNQNFSTGLTVVNAGRLILLGQNDGARTVGGGPIVVNAGGQLQTDSNNTLGQQITGKLTPVVLNGGTFRPNAFNHINSLVLMSNAVVELYNSLGGDGLDLRNLGPTNAAVHVLGSAATITNSARMRISNGTIDTYFNIQDNGPAIDAQFAGKISGSAARYAIVTNTGTLLLSGADDNDSFQMVVNTGRVIFGKTSSGTVHALGGGGDILVVNGGFVQVAGTGGDQLYTQGDIRMNGGVLDLNGWSDGYDALNGNSGVIKNDAVGTVATNSLGENNANGLFGGVLQDGNGVLALRKNGTGTQSLTNANPFTGPTTISVGTLALSNTVGMALTATPSVQIGGGGTNAVLLLGVSEQFPASAGVAFLSGVASGTSGKLQLMGNRQTVASLRQLGGTVSVIQDAETETVNADATLIVNNAATNFSAFDNILRDRQGGSGTGRVNIVKDGAGSLALGSSNLLHTGTTTLSNGTLAINGALNGSALSLAAGTLAGTGTIGRAVTVPAGVTVQPGYLVAASALSMSQATFNAGATLNALAGGTGAILRVLANNGLTIPSAGTMAVVAGPVPVTGTYMVVDYAGALQGGTVAANIAFTAPPRMAASLVDNAGNSSIDMTVTALGEAIKWTGAADGQWDVNTTTNWLTQTSLLPTAYLQPGAVGDQVLFDDTASGNFNITIAAPVSPASLAVSNELNDYTWSGAAIGGAAGLVKDGAAKLTVNTVNGFGGPTLVRGGTLAIASDAALGVVPATATPSQLVLRAGATLAIGSSYTYPLNRGLAIGTAGSAGAATIDTGSNTLVFAAVIDNVGGATGGLTKTGSGELNLAAANKITGAMRVKAGIVRVGALTALGNPSSITVDSGGQVAHTGIQQTNLLAYSIAGTGPDGRGAIVNSNATLAGNSTIRWLNLTSNATIGALGNPGTEGNRMDVYNSQGNGFTLTKVGGSSVSMREASSNLQLVVAEGFVYTEFVTNGLGTNNIVNAGAFLGAYGNVPGRVLRNPVVLNGGTLASRQGANAGAVTWAGPVTLTADSFIATRSPQYGTEEGILIAGDITGPFALTFQSAASNIVLLGTNTYSGGSFITNGAILQVGSNTPSGTLPGNATNNGTLIFNRSDAYAHPGQIAGVGTLFQAGTGTSTLSAVGSTFLGGIQVTNGGLIFDGGTFGNPSTNINTRSLQIGRAGPVVIITNNAQIYFPGHVHLGCYASGSSGTLYQYSGLLSIGGVEGTGAAARAFEVGEWPSENSAFHQLGGTVIVTNGPTFLPWNASQGLWNIENATAIVHTLRFNSGSAGLGILNLPSGKFTVGPGGLVRLTGTANINLGGGTVSAYTNWTTDVAMTLTASNGPATFDTAGWNILLSNALSGAGGLIKSGAGALTLNGTNSFTGATVVSGGSLVLAGSLSTGGVTVAAGATLTGGGTANGNVNSSGFLAPGVTSGLFTINGNYSQTNGGTLAIDIGGAAPGVLHDRLDISGSAELGGTLSVSLIGGYVPSSTDQFVIVNATSGSGTFTTTNLPALAAGSGWKIDYLAGAVILSVTNGPLATGYDLAATVITNGLTGYQDDADGDGYANLLEYVTGGSLTNAGNEAKMQGTRTNGLLALRFNRDTNAIDATIVVEGSGSAANSATWLGIATNIGGSWGAATNVVSAGTNSPLSETVYDTDSGTNRFLRLRVTRP